MASYLRMLLLELQGQKFVKKRENAELRKLLDDRSAASVEFKYRNVSAALVDLGLPYVVGYLPARNYRVSLLDELGRQLPGVAGLDTAALAFVERSATPPRLASIDGVLVERPPVEPPRCVDEPRVPRIAKRDYLAIEAANRSLGFAGECFVLEFERLRLRGFGKSRLAGRVEHIAHTRGDGAGYDILSFEPDGRERHVEVKTTSYAAGTPFFVSVNELRFARANDASHALARVFDFRRQPRFFELAGDLQISCVLDPVTYRAAPAPWRQPA